MEGLRIQKDVARHRIVGGVCIEPGGAGRVGHQWAGGVAKLHPEAHALVVDARREPEGVEELPVDETTSRVKTRSGDNVACLTFSPVPTEQSCVVDRRSV